MKAALTRSDVAQTPDTHGVESAVRRRLLSEPGYQVTQLVVRRFGTGDTVCLEGVVYVDEGAEDVEKVVGEVRGVKDVLNHMLVCDSPGRRCDKATL